MESSTNLEQLAPSEGRASRVLWFLLASPASFYFWLGFAAGVVVHHLLISVAL
jgi:hypothetical protein